MTAPSYTIPARIETARLVIRRYETDDAQQLVDVVGRNVAHLERYMEWIAFEPQTAEQRRAWIEETNAKFDAGEDFTFGIFNRDGALIGGTGFHIYRKPDRLEIGYWVDRDFEGQGLITETAAALTRVALEFAGASIVDIAASATNTRSEVIPARLGYERQATPGHEVHDDGVKVPGVMWWATRATLATEPLASTPRPMLFDDAGAPLAWED